MQLSRDDLDNNHKRQKKIGTTILKEENLLSRAPVLLEIKEQKMPRKGSGQDLEAGSQLPCERRQTTALRGAQVEVTCQGLVPRKQLSCYSGSMF